MTTQACKKRRAVYISSESEDSGTDSEVEGSKLSKKSGVTSVYTCGHQPSSKNKVDPMNTSKSRQCGSILKKLMDHKSGWIFNTPVDPVIYGIPDYFDVIRNPMDLGTVKRKLTSKQYSNPYEFAADVRLTFSNAMKYNPPGNDVHAIADQLNKIFDLEWKLLERKWKDRNLIQEQPALKGLKAQVAVTPKPSLPKGVTAGRNSAVSKTLATALSSKVKIKFSVRGSELTSSKDTPLQAVARRDGSINQSLPCSKDNANTPRIQSSEDRSESTEEEYLPEEPLSPSKALRAAMLKSRFAGTIVKAQQKALLDHGKKIDPAKLQLEKERLEKRQQEEKARIEAQVKAAEAAAQLKLDEEMRMKREQERRAARLALHMMKKTVDIDNSDFLKDLENLSKKWELNPPGKLIVDFVDGIDLPPGLGSPLERLGLFMKKDLEEEVEHEMEDSVSPSAEIDVEEGEISFCQ
uniref:Bromo domain-containing protein n=1 Tax=Oryza punctata TaxID=4537 RepID=A0A0E0LL36_ORYPU